MFAFGASREVDAGSTCSYTESGAVWTLVANCTTDGTIIIPNGITFNGAGRTITAVDPAGGHFIGAIIRNGGTTANITNLTLNTAGLADVCDSGNDRLRGILFEGASGAITNNNVLNLNQGASGCQEGNAIDVRNAPYNTSGPDLQVTIAGNTVNAYQKNGITPNGSVSVTITGNSITGAGPIGSIAQNGIQVGFGATATIRDNEITANNYTPKDTVACGLLLFNADGVSASKNTYRNNERNECNFSGGGQPHPNP